MVPQDRLERPYEDYTIRSKVWYRCDYCGTDFQRVSPRRRISKTGCPGGVTERQWSLEHGLARVWDCGRKRWRHQLT